MGPLSTIAAGAAVSQKRRYLATSRNNTKRRINTQTNFKDSSQEVHIVPKELSNDSLVKVNSKGSSVELTQKQYTLGTIRFAAFAVACCQLQVNCCCEQLELLKPPSIQSKYPTSSNTMADADAEKKKEQIAAARKRVS